MSETLERLSAFTTDPMGGNPAGVWIGDNLPSPEKMQKIAADVGFSETAFVAPSTGSDRTIRYYSPETEVSFCGHATIATGVVLGEKGGDGTYQLSTTVGVVPVSVGTSEGHREASLTSVNPRFSTVPESLVNEALAVLGWQRDELDEAIPPAKAYAGAWHLVLATADKSRLDDLNYDFETLKALMIKENITTLQLVWRERADIFHARNPFPVGGVAEEPATGAAAAALGGYLREAKLIAVPATFLSQQGEVMGRPSKIRVEVPVADGIVVTGNAVQISG